MIQRCSQILHTSALALPNISMLLKNVFSEPFLKQEGCMTFPNFQYWKIQAYFKSHHRFVVKGTPNRHFYVWLPITNTIKKSVRTYLGKCILMPGQ